MSDAEVIANERAAFAEWYYTKRRDGMSPYEIAVGMHIEHIARCNDTEPTAPQPDSVPQDSGERAAFEVALVAYFAEMQSDRAYKMDVEDVSRWRGTRGNYADRPVVRGMWEGWQRRAALAQKAVPIAVVEQIGYIIPTLLKELAKDRDIVLWPKRSGQATFPVYANALALDATAETDWRAGIEAAAKMLDRKADHYALEYGTEDMGALSFGSDRYADAKREYHSTLIELAEEIRAMVPPAPIAVRQRCKICAEPHCAGCSIG